MFKLKNSKINYIDLLCVAFLLTFPLIILIIGNMAPTYYINDDFYLKQIVSGQFTGTPNAYLFHMGYLFGLVVSPRLITVTTK